MAAVRAAAPSARPRAHLPPSSASGCSHGDAHKTSGRPTTTLRCCSGRLLQVAAATPLGEVALRCPGGRTKRR